MRSDALRTKSRGTDLLTVTPSCRATCRRSASMSDQLVVGDQTDSLADMEKFSDNERRIIWPAWRAELAWCAAFEGGGADIASTHRRAPSPTCMRAVLWERTMSSPQRRRGNVYEPFEGNEPIVLDRAPTRRFLRCALLVASSTYSIKHY